MHHGVQHGSPRSRVVVTKVGALTPIGLGYAAMKQGLRRGQPGLAEITLFGDEPAIMGRRGGELRDLVPQEVLGRKGLRNKDRLTLMALCCVQRDLAAAIAEISAPERVGLVMGTTFSSLTSQVDFTAAYERGGMRALNAMEFPNMVLNTASSQTNIWFDLAASSTTLTNGFTAGLDALIFAVDQIRCGRATQIVAGGADDLSIASMLAFERVGLISPSFQARPFDRDADGTLLGEGAAMVLLENLAQAQGRDADIVAEVLGCAATFDASASVFARSAAEPRSCDAPARAMRLALEDAAIEPDQVDFIAASASGIGAVDRAEANAIARVFGSKAQVMPIVAYKSYWGDCLGASGALQVAAALADLEDGVVSATCGFNASEVDLGVTRAALRPDRAATVLINAVGYTGNCSALVLRRGS